MSFKHKKKKIIICLKCPSWNGKAGFFYLNVLLIRQYRQYSAIVQRGQESLYLLMCVCDADSRHSYVAAIYNDVSELLASWLIWQLQSVGCPE